MPSIEESLQVAKQQLINAGLTDSPQIDAELLLCHTLDKPRSYLFTWPEKNLTSEQELQFSSFLEQRIQGHPIAHIIGQREFWGLNLKVTADTLIPRPDTETLIEAALELKPGDNSTCSILDLGTGTGAIALALKSELSQCQVIAVDQSRAALEVAQHNAQSNQLDVQFIHSNWLSAIEDQQFNCIVSNPPYIEDDDPHLQQGDVRFEPLSALASGQDGLDDIRIICQQGYSHIKPNGWLIIEHGYNQAEAIHELFAQYGYQNIQLRKDYGGNPRVTLGQKLD